MLCIHCGAINSKETQKCIQCGKDIYELIKQKTDVPVSNPMAGNQEYGNSQEKNFVLVDAGSVKKSGYASFLKAGYFLRLLSFMLAFALLAVPLFYFKKMSSYSNSVNKTNNDIKTSEDKESDFESDNGASGDISNNYSSDGNVSNNSNEEAANVGAENEAAMEALKSIKEARMNPASLMIKAIDEVKKAKAFQARSGLEVYFSQNDTYPDTLDELYPYYVDRKPDDWLIYDTDNNNYSYTLEFELSPDYSGTDEFVITKGKKKIFRLTSEY